MNRMSRMLCATLAMCSVVAHAEIVIGQSADLSGGNREQARQIVAGAQACLQAVNAQGGVRGQTLRLITLDDSGKARRAALNTAELLRAHKAAVLFGYTNRVTSEAGMAAAIEARAVFFAPASGGESLRQPASRYVFHTRAGYGAEYRKMVDTFVASGNRSFGYVVNTDDERNSNRDAIEAALRRHGLTARASGVLPRGEVAVGEAVEAMLAADPGVIILGASGKSVAPFITALKRRGYSGRFAAISFLVSTLPKELAPEHAYGLVATTVVPPPTRVDRLVREARRDLLALDPEASLSFAHLEGYLAARVLVEGLRRSSGEGGEALVRALETIEGLQLSEKVRIGFSSGRREGNGFVDVAIVARDGSLTF